eukprot:gene31934-8932_t
MAAQVLWGSEQGPQVLNPSPTLGTRQHKSKLPFDAVFFKGVLDWLEGQLDGWYPPGSGHVPQVVMDHAKQHTT